MAQDRLLKKLARENPEDPQEVHRHLINVSTVEREVIGQTNAKDQEVVDEDTVAPVHRVRVIEKRININLEEEEEDIVAPVDQVDPGAAVEVGLVDQILADQDQILQRKKIKERILIRKKKKKQQTGKKIEKNLIKTHQDLQAQEKAKALNLKTEKKSSASHDST